MEIENIRVTKKFMFDMAHALYGHDGACANIHGHTYNLAVTIFGAPLQESTNPKNGMVIDFGDLKKIVQREVIERFDHALVLNGNSPHSKVEVLHQQFNKIILVPFQPSCENLLIEIKNTLVHFFNVHHQLISLRLDETQTSFAEWHLSDNQPVL